MLIEIHKFRINKILIFLMKNIEYGARPPPSASPKWLVEGTHRSTPFAASSSAMMSAASKSVEKV